VVEKGSETSDPTPNCQQRRFRTPRAPSSGAVRQGRSLSILMDMSGLRSRCDAPVETLKADGLLTSRAIGGAKRRHFN
jgi:hypothetical protein